MTQAIQEGVHFRIMPVTAEALVADGIVDYCDQICGGGNCGGAIVCMNGIDFRTHMPATPEVMAESDSESFIAARAETFDALEIHGVRDLNEPNDPQGTFCEVDEDNPGFFSVYAHLIEGGIECLGDFPDHDHALRYANEIGQKFGWSVGDYVNERFKKAVS